jgi:hypothetical protein
MANSDSMQTFYDNNPEVQGFEHTPRWNVTIDGVKFVWAPIAPYFSPEESKDGYRMFDQMNSVMQRIDIDDDGTFNATPTGPRLHYGFGSPHAVRYVIESIYDLEEDDVVFSKDAPIFEPEQKGTYS